MAKESTEPERTTEDYFKVKGVKSTVLNENRESLGHVLMLDMEETDISTVNSRLDQIEEIKIAYIFVSSINEDSYNYHVLVPQVFSKREIKDIQERIPEQDENHTSIGFKRGDWVLRVDDKPLKNKVRPFFIEAYVRSIDEDVYFSKPHLKLYEEFSNKPTLHESVKHDRLELADYILDTYDNELIIGSKAQIVEYRTYK